MIIPSGFLTDRIFGKSIQFCGNDGGDPPAVPTYDQSFPSWAQGLPQQQLDLINQYANSQLAMPAEYGQAGNVYQGLLNYKPENFQYPMEAIQKALQAQQDQQYQQYQKQINPILASQGQYDSSYRTNLNSDFLKNQQTQALGNTANLLTNQATQNYDLSKWLPQLYGTAAQGLSGLGTQQANINNLNQQRPLQANSALSGVFGQGLQVGDRNYQSAMAQYQQALDQYNADQANNSAGIGSIFGLGGGALGAGLSLAAAPFTGGASLSFLPQATMLGSTLGGSISPLFGGTSPQNSGANLGSALQGFDLSKLFGNGGLSLGSPDLSSSIYNPNFYGGNSFNPSAASRAFSLY